MGRVLMSSTSSRTRAGLPQGLASVGLLLGLGVLWSCETSAAGAVGALDKIGFDLTALDADGLIGEGNGRRALDYELCVPRRPGTRAEVAAIDPSARFMAGSPGRIGCAPEQVLVLGNTHQPGFARVLARLAELPYVTRIQRAWFE